MAPNYNSGLLLANNEARFEAFFPRCDVCQRFENVVHVPAEALHSVTSPWPFYKWGMDIMRPLPLAASESSCWLALITSPSRWKRKHMRRLLRHNSSSSCREI